MFAEEEQPRTLEPVMEASEAEPPAAATKGKKAPPPVAKPAVAKVSSKSQVNRDDQRASGASGCTRCALPLRQWVGNS